MSSIKSRLGNVSPHSQSSHYEELQFRAERELVDNVRKQIKGWPKKLQDLFNEIHDEVIVDNELLKMFEVLVEVKRDLDEGDNDLQEHKVVRCISYLYTNAPYLREKFKTILRNHDQECVEVTNFSYIQPECAEVPNSSSNILVSYFWWIIGLLFCCVLGMIFIRTSNFTNVEHNKIAEWTQNIKDLQEKFPSQNDKVWFNILSGVKTIVTEKPTKPSVLLLLHNDKKTSACLANEVGKEAVKLLSDSLQEPIIIQGEHLKLNESLAKDYGLFTESYKHDIEKKHVMIVLDLQEVPGIVAQTFHVLCDIENPLVRNAAFLFTMQVDEKLKQQPTKIAEDYLSRLWKNSLPSDIMDPLITRITDAVVAVKMESHLPC